MFTASPLLLLTLILNVQLCSSAPISAKVVQSSVVAEEPGPEELEPAEDREPVQKFGPDVAEEVVLSPEVLPVKEDIGNVAEEPVLIGKLVFADLDEAVSQEMAHRVLLSATPDAYSEKEIDASLAEASPAATVESESADQHRVEDQAQKAPIQVIPSETLEDEAQKDPGDKEATPGQMLLILHGGNSEVEADAFHKPLPKTPEEDKSVVPTEAETEDAVQDKYAWEETAPEESAVMILEVPAEQKPDTENQGKTIHVVSSDTKAQDHTKEEEDEAVDPIVLEEDTEEDPIVITELEEESLHLFLAQFEDEEEPSAESGPEDPAVIVPIEGESEQEDEVIEEAIYLDYLLEEEKIEAPEDYIRTAVTVPADLETDEEGQEETATQESFTEEEAVPEDLNLVIIPLEDRGEEVSEEDTEEVQSDPLPEEPALGNAVPRDDEPDDGDPGVLVIAITETTSEAETVTLDPTEKVQTAATETLIEASVEPVASLAPAVTEAEVETDPSSVEDVTVSSNTTYTDDFLSAVILTEDESGVNRGAVLGAAFFTLVSLIVIGIVAAFVSKKLRQ